MLRRISFIFFIIIMIMQSTTAIAEEPVFDIVICADTTRFNPGENLTFNLYFVGIGNITDDYLLFYVDSYIYIEKLIHLGNDVTSGLNDQAKNAQAITPVIAGLEPGEGYRGKKLYPTYAMHRELNVPPLMVTLATRPNVSSGEHELKVIYLFKGEGDEWNKVTEKFTFHITTEAEQIEYEALLQNLLQPFLNVILYFAIFVFGIVFDRLQAKIRHKRLLKRLYSSIKNEIKSNRNKAKNISSVPSNAVPSNRMEVSNKESVWSKIIEYEDKNYDLLKDISYLYDKYGLLNRTIDSGFSFIAQNKPLPKGLSQEIKRICGVIETDSKKILSTI